MIRLANQRSTLWVVVRPEACKRRPSQRLRRCGYAEGIEIVVIRANVDGAVRNGGRGLNLAASPILPNQGSVLGIERIDVIIVGSDKDNTVDHRRRYVAFSLHGECPDQRAGTGV